jgi:hypothetical protein
MDDPVEARFATFPGRGLRSRSRNVATAVSLLIGRLIGALRPAPF